jgi:hypothetical protein
MYLQTGKPVISQEYINAFFILKDILALIIHILFFYYPLNYRLSFSQSFYLEKNIFFYETCYILNYKNFAIHL